MALARIVSCWGARITLAAQRKLAAHVIRGVEAHKTATDFVLSATVRGCNMLDGRAGGQCGWRPNYSTGVSLLVGGVNLAGLVGALVGGSDVQGNAV